MTEKQKTEIERTVNNLLQPMNVTFRFATTVDRNDCNTGGVAWLARREIVVRRTEHSSTLAHEIAHFTEYDKYGETSCRNGGRGGRHLRLETLWRQDLELLGIALEWDRLTGWA